MLYHHIGNEEYNDWITYYDASYNDAFLSHFCRISSWPRPMSPSTARIDGATRRRLCTAAHVLTSSSGSVVSWWIKAFGAGYGELHPSKMNRFAKLQQRRPTTLQNLIDKRWRPLLQSVIIIGLRLGQSTTIEESIPYGSRHHVLNIPWAWPVGAIHHAGGGAVLVEGFRERVHLHARDP